MRKMGRLEYEYRPGRRLWKEEYIGPEKYAGEDEKYWRINKGWWLLRGDGQVLSKEWFRIGFGKAYTHFRFRPFIFVFSRYTRKYDLYIRWNKKEN